MKQHNNPEPQGSSNVDNDRKPGGKFKRGEPLKPIDIGGRLLKKILKNCSIFEYGIAFSAAYLICGPVGGILAIFILSAVQGKWLPWTIASFLGSLLLHRSQLIISNKYGNMSSQAKTWIQITSGPASQKYGEFIKSFDEQFNPNTQKSEREERRYHQGKEYILKDGYWQLAPGHSNQQFQNDGIYTDNGIKYIIERGKVRIVGPQDNINESKQETKQTYNDRFSDPEFHNDPDRMIFEGEEYIRKGGGWYKIEQ